MRDNPGILPPNANGSNQLPGVKDEMKDQIQKVVDYIPENLDFSENLIYIEDADIEKSESSIFVKPASGIILAIE